MGTGEAARLAREAKRSLIGRLTVKEPALVRMLTVSKRNTIYMTLEAANRGIKTLFDL